MCCKKNYELNSAKYQIMLIETKKQDLRYSVILPRSLSPNNLNIIILKIQSKGDWENIADIWRRLIKVAYEVNFESLWVFKLNFLQIVYHSKIRKY